MRKDIEKVEAITDSENKIPDAITEGFTFGGAQLTGQVLFVFGDETTIAWRVRDQATCPWVTAWTTERLRDALSNGYFQPEDSSSSLQEENHQLKAALRRIRRTISSFVNNGCDYENAFNTLDFIASHALSKVEEQGKRGDV